MLIKVSVDPALNVGDLVQWDGASSSWVALTDPSVRLFGVVVSELVADQSEGSTLTLARVQFAGECRARASRAVPDEGGILAIEAGGVYVDASSAHDCGFVAPTHYNGEARDAGSLVVVYLR